MNCYKALYLWLGDSVDALINGLKALQKDALKKELPEFKEKNPNFKRLTRTEKAKKMSGGLVEEIKEEPVVIDKFAIAPAKDILTTYNSAWIDNITASKTWAEKRDKLVNL